MRGLGLPAFQSGGLSENRQWQATLRPGDCPWVDDFHNDEMTENRIRNGVAQIPLPCLTHTDSNDSADRALRLSAQRQPPSPSGVQVGRKALTKMHLRQKRQMDGPIFGTFDARRADTTSAGVGRPRMAGKQTKGPKRPTQLCNRPNLTSLVQGELITLMLSDTPP
jgi:hypothetical protein